MTSDGAGPSTRQPNISPLIFLESAKESLNLVQGQHEGLRLPLLGWATWLVCFRMMWSWIHQAGLGLRTWVVSSFLVRLTRPGLTFLRGVAVCTRGRTAVLAILSAGVWGPPLSALIPCVGCCVGCCVLRPPPKGI